MNFGSSSGRRFKRRSVAQNGDCIILSNSKAPFQAVRLESGKIFNCKYGNFAHDDMIGQPFGSWIQQRIPNKQREESSNDTKPSPEDQKVDSMDSEKDKMELDASSKAVPVGKKRRITQIREKSKALKSHQNPGEICILRPNCELWTLALSHRTQILYDADKSMICFLLQIQPNDIVFESGTGSGSLSTSLSRMISPFGHLFTFEFNALRAEYARMDFKNLLIDRLITVIHRNIEDNGFPKKKQLLDIIGAFVTQYKLHQKSSKPPITNGDVNGNVITYSSTTGTVNGNPESTESKETSTEKRKSEYKDSFGGRTKLDKWSWMSEEKIRNLEEWISKLKDESGQFVNGIFLDLPRPYLDSVIESAHLVMKDNGKICSFSPCIEQVQKTCQSLGRNGFIDIRTFEVLSNNKMILRHKFPAVDLETKNFDHSVRSVPRSETEEKSLNEDRVEMITSRPAGRAMGHTGYLTFAMKALGSTRHNKSSF